MRLLVSATFLLLALSGCKVNLVQEIIGDVPVAPTDTDVVQPDGEVAGQDVVVDPCAGEPPAWFSYGVCAAIDPATHPCKDGEWTLNTEGMGTYETDERTCDGLDNDCDGSTDEGITAHPADAIWGDEIPCSKKGPCGSGARAICNPDTESSTRWICDYSGVSGWEPEESRCDGKDNDCDGKADEDLSIAAATCETKGVCGALKLIFADAETPEGKKAVRCEGGKWACEYSVIPEWQDPDPAPPGEGEEEVIPGETLCDGLDNDCDGKTDAEDDDSGVWAEVPGADAGCRTEGVCADVKAACVEGAWACAYPDLAHGYEEGSEYKCDGLDNDCDGKTDEGQATVPFTALPAYVGDSLTCAKAGARKGVCAALQVATCQGAGTGAAKYECVYSGIPGYEPGAETKCDGLDNDCDGDTDEQLANLAGVQGGCPEAKGVCAGKMKATCSQARWICQIDPTFLGWEANGEETCDGKDNDCDGDTDEDLFLTSTDDVAELVARCPAGDKGVCQGKTYTYCTAAATWQCVYAAPAYEAGTEIRCDGLDNDCDGKTDEDFGAPTAAQKAANCPGLGICAGKSISAIACTAGVPACTYTGVGPAYEAGKETRCDGLDNDCDGRVDGEDPDFLNPAPEVVSAACPATGVCAGKAATYACNHGVVTCAYSGMGPDYEADTETRCDGKDNDCDGATDEDLFRPDSTGACGGDAGVCRAGGRERCDGADTWVCDYAAVVGYEPFETSCDNLDNDCDGDTDEGLRGSVEPEGTCVDEGVCAASTNVVVDCVDAAWVCDYSAVDGWREAEEEDHTACDKLDNDCDGQTDEQLCGAPGSLCEVHTDCQVLEAGGSANARCRLDIAGINRFCAVDDIGCVLSQNGVSADQVPNGAKRCSDERKTKSCNKGDWTAEAVCPIQTPYCTDLADGAPCSFCPPDAPTCSDAETIGICSADGAQYDPFQPCPSGSFCAGQGLCLPGAEFTVNAFTASAQEQPDVAYHPMAGFVVVWASRTQDNSDFGIAARRFSSEGLKMGQEFLVNASTVSVQTQPAVAARPDGGFTATWRSSHVSTQASIYLRRFDGVGDPLDGADVLVIQKVPDKVQQRPDVAVNKDGVTLLAWQSNGNEVPIAGCTVQTCKDGIAARVLSAGGELDDEILVNEALPNAQGSPAVAALPSGNFVVVWQSEKQDDGASFGVYGRVLKASGSAQTSEFRINQATAGNQISPKVTACSDGKFVVAWNTAAASTGGISYQVWARVMKADGTPDGNEFRVSGDSTDATLGGLTLFSDDFPLFAWHQPSDGGGYGIFGAVYTTSGVTDGPFILNQTIEGDQTTPTIAATGIFTYLTVWVGPDASTSTDLRGRMRLR